MRRRVYSFICVLLIVIGICGTAYALDVKTATITSTTNSSIKLLYCAEIQWETLFYWSVTGSVATQNVSSNYNHKSSVTYFLYNNGAAIKAKSTSTSKTEAILVFSSSSGDKLRSIHSLINPNTETAVLSYTNTMSD